MANLKGILSDRRQLAGLSSDDCCRSVAAFFRMLGVEFRHATKGGVPSEQTAAKLQHLLRDARALLNAVVPLYPEKSLLDALDDILDATTPLLRNAHIPPALHSDLVGLLNCILTDRSYLLQVPLDGMQAMVRFIRTAFHNPATAACESECSKTILALARYHHDANNVPVLKELLTIALAVLGRDEQTLDVTGCVNILRVVRVGFDALAESHPIFCRTAIRTLIPLLDRALFRRPHTIDELVQVLEGAIPFAAADGQIRCALVAYLDSAAVKGRLKLETRSPVQIATGQAPDDVQNSFLACLAAYFQIPESITGPRSSRNEVDTRVTVLFAKALKGNDALPAGMIQSVAEMLPKSAISEANWLLVLLSLCHQDADAAVAFALQCIERSVLHEAAAYYLARLIETKGRHFPDLADRMTYLASLSPSSVRLLRLNFCSRYSQILWSDSAKRSFSSALNLVDHHFDAHVDGRLGPAKLHLLLPELTQLLLAPTDAFFRDRAMLTVCRQQEYITATDPAAVQSFFGSKWNDHNISAGQAQALLQLPLALIAASLEPSSSGHLEVLFQEVARISQKSVVASWLWSNARHVVADGPSFHSLHISELLSIALQAFQQKGNPGMSDAFAAARTQESASAVQKEEGLELLIDIYKRLLDLPAKDADLEAICEDCSVFIMDQLCESRLAIERVISICGNLPYLSDALSPRASRLLACYRAGNEILPLLELAWLLLQKNKTLDHRVLDDLLDACATGAVTPRGRIIVVRLAQLLGRSPDFLPNEFSVPVLSASCMIAELPDVIPDEPDRIAGCLFRLASSERSKKEVLAAIGKCLATVATLDDGLFEIHAQLDRIVSGEEQKLAAAAFIRCTMGFSAPHLPGSVEQAESYWFWTCCKTNSADLALPDGDLQVRFAPVVAKCLLEHALGRKNEVMQRIKSSMGPPAFDLEFKAQFLRVFAFVLLYALELDCPPPIVEKCLDHLCSIFRTKIDDIYSSFYGQILLLELLDIGQFDLALQDSFTKCFSNVCARIPVIHEPLAKCLTSHLRAASLIQVVSDKTVPVSPSAGVSSETAAGLALTLSGEIASLSPRLALICSKKALELVTRGDIKAVPASLQHLQLPNGQRSVLKAIPRRSQTECVDGDGLLSTLISLQPQSVIGRAREMLLSDERITEACSQWIFAETLMGGTPELVSRLFSMLTWSSPAQLLLAFAEAAKLVRVLGAPPLPNTVLRHQEGTHRIKDHPEQWLYILELFSSRPTGSIREVYSLLGDPDYVEYFDSLSDALLPGPSQPTSTADGAIAEAIEHSMLLNQQWDLTDVAETFDPQSAADKLFLHLRDMVNTGTGAREKALPLHSAAGIGRLVTLAAMASVDPPASDAFVKEALDQWSVDRTLSSSGFGQPVIRVVAQAARRTQCPSLAVLESLCKGDYLLRHGQTERALRILSDASRVCIEAGAVPPELSTRVLLKTAKCAWTTRSRPANQIQRDILERIAVEDLPSSLASKAFHCIARFYDEQFQKDTTTEALQTRKRLLAKTRQELDNVNQLLAQTAPKDKTAIERDRTLLQNQVRQDTIEIERIMTEREQYAVKAATNYFRAIVTGEKYNLTVFRLCSIWFTYRRSPQVNRLVADDALPVHKLVPLMYQLAARAEAVDHQDLFQETLQKVLLRTLTAHPHHSLYQLLALRATGDPPTAGSKRKLIISGGAQERRTIAAGQIVAKARTASPQLNTLICDTEKLWSAYTEMALFELPIETSTKVTHPFPTGWLVRRISSLSCPVPTRDTPVNAAGDYRDIVTVGRFNGEGYRLVGGINLPKIVECQGSDGKFYRQLVKGRDDVRQVRTVHQVLIFRTR